MVEIYQYQLVSFRYIGKETFQQLNQHEFKLVTRVIARVVMRTEIARDSGMKGTMKFGYGITWEF